MIRMRTEHIPYPLPQLYDHIQSFLFASLSSTDLFEHALLIHPGNFESDDHICVGSTILGLTFVLRVCRENSTGNLECGPILDKTQCRFASRGFF